MAVHPGTISSLLLQVQSSMEVARMLEQYISFGVFVVALALATFSVLAWRREREPRMLLVAIGYGMFAVYGLVIFLEYILLVSLFSYETVEIVEHAASILVLGGLLTFFVALVRW